MPAGNPAMTDSEWRAKGDEAGHWLERAALF
jgi:hypothetical protein